MSAAPFQSTRRQLLQGGGALVVSFAIARRLHAVEAVAQTTDTPPAPTPELPGSLKTARYLDAWIRVDADGSVTVFTGKAELGQGIKTALIQVAAEEIEIAPTRVRIVTADTERTANEGYTAGSHSMQDSGTAIKHAAAQARAILIGLAAERLDVAAESLSAHDGKVVSGDGRSIGFGELVSDTVLHVEAQPTSPLKDPKDYTLIGRAMKRIDIPAKVTGGAAYVQDMRLPGMVHARVVRPPSYGATLRAFDATAVETLPGIVRVVRDGSFIAVVAQKEFQAVVAMRALAQAARWDETPSLPGRERLFETFDALPAEEYVIRDVGTPMTSPAHAVEASYRRRYQLHGSIGPSCAVAQLDGGKLTVWSHAQGMFPLRDSIAEMLGMNPEQVHCIHVEGSGCYGHNGADDAAADAALIAREVAGRPVRVQWMRDQEHIWEPYGSVMTTHARAALGPDGKIAEWTYEVKSATHSTRPPGAGQLLAARHLATPFQPPAPKPLPQPEGGGDRNAIPLYELPRVRVVHRFVTEMPLRVSALRGLGAYMNVFSIESFMDELAAASDKDPVAFRLAHLRDERARAVIATAAERFGWSRPNGKGHGFAFARYKNLGAYLAVAVEIATDPDQGRVRLKRAVAAVDSGEAVNPDGIRNQVEGGILQSASWTLYEAVNFDEQRILSKDWSTYPILRFQAVPASVTVEVIDRPGQVFLGTGEAAQGPVAAALANAVTDATGIRPRELPLGPLRRDASPSRSNTPT
jgi:nicotinate dehydrogenase subunit B